jgi:ankyrin repeat protein
MNQKTKVEFAPTPISLAAAKALFAAGKVRASDDVVDECGNTLLTIALEYGDVELLQQLVDAGANLSPETVSSVLPKGHVAVLRWLVERNLLPAVRSVRAIAILHRRVPMLEFLLLQSTAPVVVQDLFDVVCLAPCAEVDAMARLLLRVAPDLLTALPAHSIDVVGSMLSRHDSLSDMLRTLIDRGLDCNRKTGGLTPLSHALQKGADSNALLLLASGANLIDKYDLAMAVAFCSHDVVAALLKCGGVDVNARVDDESPLFIACENGRPLEVVRLLLDAGADVRARGRDMQTPLMAAVVSAAPEVVELLLNHPDIEIEAVDTYLHTALTTACNHGDTCERIVQLLIAAGANLDHENIDKHVPVMYAAWGGHMGAVVALHAAGANLRARGQNNRLLTWASESGNLELVQWLFDHDLVDGVNEQSTGSSDEVGESAFYVACEFGRLDVAKLLISKGADVNLRTALGTTPIAAAVRKKGDASQERVIRHLLSLGVDMSCAAERSLVHLAIAHNRFGSLVALLAGGVPFDASDTSLVDAAVKSFDASAGPHMFAVLMWLGCAVAKERAPLPRELDLLLQAFDGEAPRYVNRYANWVLQELAEGKLRLINDQAINACIGMQELNLPALQTLMIVDELCPLAPFVPIHLKYRLVTTVKHFIRQ